MKISNLSLVLLLSLFFTACGNNVNPEKNMEEKKGITKKEENTPKNQETKPPPSMQDLLQGDWVDEEGMGFLSFKGDTVDMAPMGTYSFSIDKETKVISYTPIDENGVAHKNKITKLTNKVLILDPAEDNSGQHAEYSRKK